MYRQIATYVVSLSLALLILIVSVTQASSITYSFNGSPSPSPLAASDIEIDYDLPYPGRVHPDSVLWPLKATRDRALMLVTVNPKKKVELRIMLADKRLASAESLFRRSKPELAVSTLSKAEKYLEDAMIQEGAARKNKEDTTEVLEKLNTASLKHREVIKELFNIAPEDAKSEIDKIEELSQKVFSQSQTALREMGKTPPENPFED